MYYEDFTVRPGDTFASIVIAYGHTAGDVPLIWSKHENIGLRAKRAKPEDIKPGDVVMVPIPWVATTKTNTVRAATVDTAGGSTMIMHRDGGRGSFLAFVQTVNRDNQPIGPNPSSFCVDACTPDDDRPFYWTQAELKAVPDRRKQFSDGAGRSPPTAAQGITQWRAILSIAVVNKKRVTILEPTFWGFNITAATPAAPDGVITAVGPRDATHAEITGHLNLLRNGVGTSGVTFAKQGWTFREEPRLIGDFPTPSRELMYA